MPSIEYNKVHNAYKQYVKQCGITSYMFYSPTDENIYWKEQTKILIINMEPYGYDGDLENVDKHELLRWLYDDGDTGTRTIRFSVLFASLLLDHLGQKTIYQKSDIQKKYQDTKLLENTLSRIALYNIRPTSNTRKEQDVNGIINSSQGKLGEYLREEIYCLDANYIIISGKAGLEACKRVLKIDKPIQKNTPVKLGETVILAVNHFSRPAYKTWINNIYKLASCSK